MHVGKLYAKGRNETARSLRYFSALYNYFIILKLFSELPQGLPLGKKVKSRPTDVIYHYRL